MRDRALARLRIDQVIADELTKLAAKQKREAEREVRRVDRSRRNVAKLTAALKVLNAGDPSIDRTETPCNVGNIMDQGKGGA